jgi:hypothetical protein
MTWLLANWKMLAAAAVFAIYTAFVWRAGGASVRANFEAYKTQQTEQRLLADRAQRSEEQRRQAGVDQEVKDAQAHIAAARAAAATAALAADELRGARDATVARARARSCPAAPGTPDAAGDPIGVLADVLGRADARAGLLAEIADERGAAGLLCERAYDRLQPAK